MSADGSSAIEDGFGSIDVRLGAVEERRSGPGRAGAGCEAMVGVRLGGLVDLGLCDVRE